MTEDELNNLIQCYIEVDGYSDIRSIYNILSQEYPGEFERNTAMSLICLALKHER